jgi:polar amino acid transport system permease protein
VIRGGILSVDHGQYEAAAALGLPRGRQVRRIILPQAMRSILPAAFNDVIGLAKSTSVVYVLALPELFYTVQVIYRRNLEVVPLLMVATVWYLVILTVLSLLQRRVEQRFARGQLQRSVSRVSSPARATGDSAPRVVRRPRSRAAGEAGEGAAVSLPWRRQGVRRPAGAEDVNLDLRGQRDGADRPVGAGKSTLLRLSTIWNVPTAAIVTVGGQLIGYRRDGDTLYELPEREIRRRRAEVGMVFRAQPVPAPDRAGEHHRGADHGAGRAARAGRAAGAHAAGTGRPGRQGRCLPAPAVRRPAAAHRDCARAGPATEGAAVRRTRRRWTRNWWPRC